MVTLLQDRMQTQTSKHSTERATLGDTLRLKKGRPSGGGITIKTSVGRGVKSVKEGEEGRKVEVELAFDVVT